MTVKISASDNDKTPDVDFLLTCNNELDAAEAQIDAGDYLTHDEVNNTFRIKERHVQNNKSHATQSPTHRHRPATARTRCG